MPLSKIPQEGQIICDHCKYVPGMVTQCGDGDEVFHALECACKTTPYYRSQTSVVSQWNAVTHSQNPTEAYEYATKESPLHIVTVMPPPYNH